MPYDVADSVPIAWDVADAAGSPVTAGSAILTVTKPDGTTELPTVPAPTSPGQYRVTYVPTIEGRYTWRVVTTTPNTAFQEAFTVRALSSPALLSLSEVKRHLNITSSTYDDELRDYVESATEIVESYTGPIVQRTYTSRVQGGREVIILPHTQILSVTAFTSILSGTTPVQIANLSIDGEAGDIYCKNSGGFPGGAYTITYTVGRTTVKSNWLTSAKIIIKHMWETRLGGLPSGQGDDRGYVVTGSGYLVPFRAIALLNIPNSAQPMVY